MKNSTELGLNGGSVCSDLPDALQDCADALERLSNCDAGARVLSLASWRCCDAEPAVDVEMPETCDEAVAVDALRPSELLRREISGGQGGRGSVGMARKALRDVKEARSPERPDAPDFPETPEWALATD